MRANQSSAAVYIASFFVLAFVGGGLEGEVCGILSGIDVLCACGEGRDD